MINQSIDFNSHLTAWQRSGHLSKFTKLEAAESACQHAVKPLWIVLGDDDRYWVTTPRIAAELEQLGYQLA
jgi:hypothetical protein